MKIRLCSIFLSLFLLLTPFLTVHAQETVARKGKINDHYDEKYQVLKSSKKTRHGLYQVFNRDTLLAEGLYDHGKKVGRWNFYTSEGSVEQRFNYSSNQLEYYRPDTSTLQFRIESPLNPGDTIIYPAKIGPNPMTFYKFVFRSFTDPRLRGVTGEFDLYNIFYLDENGKLIRWQKKIASLNFNAVTDEEMKDLGPDDVFFTPARVNGRPVPSAIIHHTTLKTMVKVSVTVRSRMVSPPGVDR